MNVMITAQRIRREARGVCKPAFMRDYFITMRPYLMFVSGAAGAVGLAFTGFTSPLASAAVFTVMFLSYGFGQALTDCFQTDTDSISSPYRPLVKGTVTREQVLSVSVLALLSGAAALTAVNSMILIPSAISVFILATQTSFKRIWWAGPAYCSLVVALAPVIGAMSEKHTAVLNPLFLAACAGVFFSYQNFVVTGYFKDISADRATGYNTFPVAFGWAANAVYADVTSALAAVSFGAVVFMTGLPPQAAALYVAAVVINIMSQVQAHMTRDEKGSHPAIEGSVRSFVLYCASACCALRPELAAAVSVFYLAFELALKARPEESQV